MPYVNYISRDVSVSVWVYFYLPGVDVCIYCVRYTTLATGVLVRAMHYCVCNYYDVENIT